MGGQAFASRTPPLLTPRMPLNIYNQILKSTYSVLRQHFNHVEAPIEAPGKISYGDVDFLVCEPRSVDCDLTHQPFKQAAEALSQALNAKDWITERGNPTINMALPWPETAAKDRDGDKANGEETEEKFVQVDIHICPEKKSWDWELFHAAHGDLWNILGTTIRPFGLTADNVGLYLRIPEIELLDRKKSKIFLTDEPSRVLAFLGLDKGKWWTQFDNLEDMFRYAATCRMFRVKENFEGAEVEAGDVVGAIEGQEGGEQGKKKLKHNDRQRMAKRPIFAKWLEEFIPKCREEGNHFEAKVTREEIRDEAFEQFGVREQYETRLHDFQLTRHEDMMWREVLKGSVPVEGVDPQFRAAAIRTLKAIIFEGDTFDGVIVQASKQDENGFYDVEVVKKFVLENWRRAGEIGWKKQEERAREAMRAKAEKRKADEERLKLVSEKKGKVGDEDDLVKDAA